MYTIELESFVMEDFQKLNTYLDLKKIEFSML